MMDYKRIILGVALERLPVVGVRWWQLGISYWICSCLHCFSFCNKHLPAAWTKPEIITCYYMLECAWWQMLEGGFGKLRKEMTLGCPHHWMLLVVSSMKKDALQPHLLRMGSKCAQMYWQNAWKCIYREKSITGPLCSWEDRESWSRMLPRLGQLCPDIRACASLSQSKTLLHPWKRLVL